MQLDDVHGGHGQAGAVHHAPDVAVQGDVVQVVVGGLDLGLLFGTLSKKNRILLLSVRLSKHSIVFGRYDEIIFVQLDHIIWTKA